MKLMVSVGVARWKRDNRLKDLRAAKICSVLSTTKKHPHPPSEFMVDYDSTDKKEKTGKSPEEMLTAMKSIVAACGGEVIE
jgi:hypothetical protein